MNTPEPLSLGEFSLSERVGVEHARSLSHEIIHLLLSSKNFTPPPTLSSYVWGTKLRVHGPPEEPQEVSDRDRAYSLADLQRIDGLLNAADPHNQEELERMFASRSAILANDTFIPKKSAVSKKVTEECNDRDAQTKQPIPRSGPRRVTVLHPGQEYPSRIMFPGGVRRLLVDMSAGAGKSCLQWNVIGNFLDAGFQVVFVGDPDVCLAMGDGIRECPVEVRFNHLPTGGSTSAPEQVRETRLGGINNVDGKSPFCAVYSVPVLRNSLLNLPLGKREDGTPDDCKTASGQAMESWRDARMMVLGYVQAGNLVKAWIPYYNALHGLSTNKDPQSCKPKSGRYQAINPHERILWVVDECHKLFNIQEEPSTWKASLLILQDYFRRLGDDAYVLFSSASPNITTRPELTVNLFKALQGTTNKLIFRKKEHPWHKVPIQYKTIRKGNKDVRVGVEEVDQQALVADPQATHRTVMDYYIPDGAFSGEGKEFVEDAEKAILWHPGSNSNSKVRRMSSEQHTEFGPQELLNLKEKMKASHCIASGGSSKFAVDPAELYRMLRPVEAHKVHLMNLFATRTFATQNLFDYHFYPVVVQDAPMIRGVSVTAAQSRTLKECLGRKKKPPWENTSQFADVAVLKETAKRWWDACSRDPFMEMDDSTVRIIEEHAAKWKAVADDLCTDQDLRGKSAAYLGAPMLGSEVPAQLRIDDNIYNVIFAFYLVHRLNMQLTVVGIQGYRYFVKSVTEILRRQPPHDRRNIPIYILADQSDDKYDKKEVDDALHRLRGQEPLSLAQLCILLGAAFPPHLVGRDDKETSYRKSQLNQFNAERPISDDGPSAAYLYSIMVLGPGAYKAITLRATNNMFILSAQTYGKQQQTMGRIWRTCSFQEVTHQKLWRINLWVYLLSSGGGRCAAVDPLECDCVLQSYLLEQNYVVNYLRKLYLQSALACDAFVDFSQWSKTLGSFACDYKTHRPGTEGGSSKPFFACFPGMHHVSTSYYGDITEEDVRITSQGNCSKGPKETSRQANLNIFAPVRRPRERREP